MERIPFLLSALGFAACAVAADALTVIAPVSNSVVSLHTPAQELFLRLSDSERSALISDMDRSRAALHRIGWWPDPVKVRWSDARAEYLQGLVWIGQLFGVDPQKCLYCPACVDETDADLMRRAAHEALGESQMASGGVGK